VEEWSPQDVERKVPIGSLFVVLADLDSQWQHLAEVVRDCGPLRRLVAKIGNFAPDILLLSLNLF
jgi:hypothetical protein